MSCVKPSDQVRLHGPSPVNVACTVALPPAQMVPPPLTTAVGSGVMLTVLLQVLLHPLAFVTERPRVKLPEPPAFTVTDEPLAAPLIIALPLTDQ